MILGFKTQIHNKPTYFVEKIQACFDAEKAAIYRPKLHSIRAGKRWSAGKIIHFATGVRTKHYKQFHQANCTAVQDIIIVNTTFNTLLNKCPQILLYACTYLIFSSEGIITFILIDGKFINRNQLHELAINDGFDSVDSFLAYFNAEFFNGQIVHWTAKTY